MPKTIRWLISALDELDEIHSYITAKDGLERADPVVAEVFRVARALRDFPERGRVVERVKPIHRETFAYSRYRLVYRISGDIVTIAAVIDTSRKFHKAWRSRPRE